MPWRLRVLFAITVAVALSLGFSSLIAQAQGASPTGAASPTSKVKPGPSPTPSPSTASWIHAFVAPTLDASCASPNSQAQAVQVTSDGGYVLAGSAQVSTSSTTCATVYDGWIGKLTGAGQPQWQETFGCYGGNFYGFSSVQQTSDGGYILTGGEEGCFNPQCASGGFGTLNCALVVKLGSTGQLQWQQFYPGAFQSSGNQVRQTGDGGYIVAGSTQDTSNNTFAWVAKLDANGNTQWQKQIGGICAPFAEANSVQQTPDGGYIVVGGFDESSNCTGSLLALRLDASGNTLWQRGYAVGGHAGPNASVQVTADGGYVLAGIGGFQDATGSSEDAVVIKLDSNGATQWQNRYDSGRVCYYDAFGNYVCSDFGTLSYAIRQTADGGYALAGDLQILDPSDGQLVQPAWLLKTDARGQLQWQHDYYAVWAPTGHVLGSNFYGVAQSGDGGFVAVGEREYYNLQANEVWVVKTDSNGNVGTCSEVHSAGSTSLSAGLTVSVPGVPSSTVPNAGENVTKAGGAATGTLGLVQDC
jgi:hypothetical protein